MHCDQCGKENRPGSKFCRFCGNSLIDRVVTTGNTGNTGKSIKSVSSRTLVLLISTTLILGAIGFGAKEAFGYYQVRAQIKQATQLQKSGDYNKSLGILHSIENQTYTADQKKSVSDLEADDQKFTKFQNTFNEAVGLTLASSSASTSLSTNLKKALSELQSIDSSYPEFPAVQKELNSVQNQLVTTLQDEASSSKKAAADAAAKAAVSKAAASAAQSARARAEASAQAAQSEAASVAANAAAQATAVKSAEVLRSFTNQLTSISSSFGQAERYYSSAIDHSNNGDSVLALAQANSALAILNTASTNLSSMNNTFTGLPSSYSTASDDMGYAIYDLTKALDLLVSSEGTYIDYSTSINAYKDQAVQYYSAVNVFLQSN